MHLFTVLLAHDDFVVIDKPCGVSVNNEQDQPGLLPALQSQLGVEKLWLVHRLDKVTSGALLLARNATAASVLSQQFAQRQVSKFYLALSDRKPTKKQGMVCGDMLKSRNGAWKLSKQSTAPAVTQFFSCSVRAGLRLFLLKPCTGKTHQIRVMMKSIGAPICGDDLYKGTAADRTYLHAYSLSFHYAGQDYQVTSKTFAGELLSGETLKTALDTQGEPWQQAWPVVPAGLMKQLTPDGLSSSQ